MWGVAEALWPWTWLIPSSYATMARERWHVATFVIRVDKTAMLCMLLSALAISGITDLACNISRLSKEMAGPQQCRPGEVIFVGNLSPQGTYLQDSRSLI